jgi:predicted nuclease of predicted toxin-antitoxin system
VKLIADEHIPNSFIAALRAEEYDIVRSKDILPEGEDDSEIVAYAEEHNRVILSEDGDFRGREIDLDDHPGVIACETRVSAGQIVAAIREIDAYTNDLNNSIVRVPDGWV